MSSAPTPPQDPRGPVDPAGVAMPPPPPPVPGAGPQYVPMYAPQPPKTGGGMLSRILTSLIVTLLISSVVLNVYLGGIVASMYAGPIETPYVEGDSDKRIVILPIEGLVDDTMADFVHDALVELRKDKPAAIVMWVDSGGGYVAPSDRIWNELKAFKAETNIPIVASFGSTAASGAYYVSALADKIIAEPTCITGSIGVIAQAFTVHNLLDKVGVTPEVIASTDSTQKDLLNPMRAWTDRDREKIRHILDTAWVRFVEVVQEGRGKTVGMTQEEAKALATGEMYTVERAIELKLVDAEGYLQDAIAQAATLGGIAAGQKPNVTRIGPPASFGIGGLLGSPYVPNLANWGSEQLRGAATELATPRLMYR